MTRAISRNGFLLIVPAMAITFGLWSALPPAYGPESFDAGIPTALLLAENVLRIAVFGIPALLLFGARSAPQRVGWLLYGLGIAAYLGSYLAQIYLPQSAWSTSLVGFTAPAWTTLLWFLGIGLVCEDTWLHITWRPAVYIVAAALFVVVHVAHAYMVFVQG